MLLDQKYKDGVLSNYYIDSDDKVKVKTIKVEPYRWITLDGPDKSASRTYKSWKNERVKKVKAKSLDKYTKMEALWELPTGQRDRIFSQCTPLEAFVDIEVDFAKEFPRPEEVKFGVSTIATTWVDRKSKVVKIILQTLKGLDLGEKSFITRAVKKYFIDFNLDFDIKYIFHQSEQQLLDVFFSKICPKFGVITGWNFVDFDWHYLWNRAISVGLEPSEYFPDIHISYDKGSKGVGFPSNIGIIDLMDIFTKFDRSIDVKESKALEFIANEVLGIGKVSLNQSLDIVYEENFKEYCFYNIIDSVLCLLIEDKKKVLKLYYALCNTSLCDIRNTLKPTRSTETVFSNKFYESNKVIPSPGWDEPKTKKETYEGAYVMVPIAGIYKWVIARDFQSLYPTSARIGSISPESYVGNWYKTYLTSNSMMEEHKEDYLNYCVSRRYIESKYSIESLYTKENGDIVNVKTKGIYSGQEEVHGNWFSEYVSSLSDNLEHYREYLTDQKKIKSDKKYYIDPKGSVFDLTEDPVYKTILDKFHSDRQDHKKVKKLLGKEKDKLEKLYMEIQERKLNNKTRI